MAGKVVHIGTYVYRKILCSTGLRRKLWEIARQLLIRIAHDPECVIFIHERQLKMPLSHSLPKYLLAHEHYDRLPGRISDYMHLTGAGIKCIDVGANIGDSVAAFYKSDKDTFLAIEPNPKFYQYLVANWCWNSKVKAISAMCSSDSITAKFSINEKAGTASLTEAANGVEMKRQPLDEIVDNMPEFKDANILKIDTDGHDFEVIAGAAKLILSSQPTVLFECDVFGNEKYLNDCLRVLKLLQSSGYSLCLIYDNFGNLMGRYSLGDLSAIKRLIFYQLTSPLLYFDILVMRDTDISLFYVQEVNYFISKMANKNLKLQALYSAEV
jgi:FkbM family methyltransferase